MTGGFEWTSVRGFTYDIRRRIPDTTKAREVLGFEAEVDLDEGLREVIGWLRAVLPAGASA